jgi:outer membrane protein assembly factor BamB
VIGDGKVFVVARYRPDWWAGYRSRLLALSARSGAVLWERDLGGPFGAAAAYDDGRVFVSLEADDVLTAFAADDGAPLWSRLLDAVGPPVADGGVVYVNGGPGYGAYRGTDGAPLWQVISDNCCSGAPALSTETAYFSFGCEQAAIRRSDGSPIWRNQARCHGGGGRTPALVGGRLFVRGAEPPPDGQALDALTGAVVGSIDADIAPAFADGIGVFPNYGDRPFQAGHTLTAQPIAGGRPLWTFRGDGYLDSVPLIVNRTVYVGSGSGRLYGLSLRSGRVVWRARLQLGVPTTFDGHFSSGLAAGEGLLLVPALRQLVAYRR